MTPEQFAYWLQGFFELREACGEAARPLTAEQAKMIQDHLKTVFVKVTPPAKPPEVSPIDWEKVIGPVIPNPPTTTPQGPYPTIEPWRQTGPTWYRPLEIYCSDHFTICANAVQ